MSDDDRLDYRQIFPIAGRNWKRYAEQPRKLKEPRKTYGFFSESTTKEGTMSIRRTRRDLGKRYDEDTSRRPSMDKQVRTLVAKDLNRSAKSIAAELDKLDYEAAPLTVSAIREEMFRVLRLCQKHGTIIVPAWED
ncbi:hypothetical protein [Bradyrhizobium liaoningense]